MPNKSAIHLQTLYLLADKSKKCSGQNFENDGFTVVDIHVKYDDLLSTESFNLSAYLKIENAFDKRYYNVSWGTEEAFPTVPQDPRGITTGLKLKF